MAASVFGIRRPARPGPAAPSRLLGDQVHTIAGWRRIRCIPTAEDDGTPLPPKWHGGQSRSCALPSSDAHGYRWPASAYAPSHRLRVMAQRQAAPAPGLVDEFDPQRRRRSPARARRGCRAPASSPARRGVRASERAQRASPAHAPRQRCRKSPRTTRRRASQRASRASRPPAWRWSFRRGTGTPCVPEGRRLAEMKVRRPARRRRSRQTAFCPGSHSAWPPASTCRSRTAFRAARCRRITARTRPARRRRACRHPLSPAAGAARRSAARWAGESGARVALQPTDAEGGEHRRLRWHRPSACRPGGDRSVALRLWRSCDSTRSKNWFIPASERSFSNTSASSRPSPRHAGFFSPNCSSTVAMRCACARPSASRSAIWLTG